MARFLGHLPLVRLAPGTTSLATHGGRVRAVPFEEWHQYDDHFPFGDRDYEQTAPCFFERELSVDADLSAEVDAFENYEDAASADLRLGYEALLLVTGARLPRPEMSMAYLVFDGNDLPEDVRGVVLSSQRRRIGPAERELIVHGSQARPVPVDDAVLHDVDQVWMRLEQHGQDISPALDALTRTTRPGYTPLNETMHLIAGLEALLVERGEPLTSTFSRRYAVLATDNEIEAMSRQAKFLYGLRSDVMHGRVMPALSEPWLEFLQHDHRYWTCLIIRRILAWLVVTDGALEGLRKVLDDAQASPRDLENFRATSGRLGE
jgi:hypothetical protein